MCGALGLSKDKSFTYWAATDTGTAAGVPSGAAAEGGEGEDVMFDLQGCAKKRGPIKELPRALKGFATMHSAASQRRHDFYGVSLKKPPWPRIKTISIPAENPL